MNSTHTLSYLLQAQGAGIVCGLCDVRVWCRGAMVTLLEMNLSLLDVHGNSLWYLLMGRHRPLKPNESRGPSKIIGVKRSL